MSSLEHKIQKYREKIKYLKQFAGTNIVHYGSKDLIISKKDLEYVSPNNLSGTGTNTVYFVLQKLNSINIGQWTEYARDQQRASGRAAAQLGDGIRSFIMALQMHSNRFEMWVAFATSNRIDDTFDLVSSIDVEMCFTVSMKSGIPISTHMGIFRNYYSIRGQEARLNAHKNLANHLHVFSIKATTILYSNIYYMVTRPTAIMRDIIIKYMDTVGKSNLLWVGSMADRVVCKDRMMRIDKMSSFLDKNIDADSDRLIELYGSEFLPGQYVDEDSWSKYVKTYGKFNYRIDQLVADIDKIPTYTESLVFNKNIENDIKPIIDNMEALTDYQIGYPELLVNKTLRQLSYYDSLDNYITYRNYRLLLDQIKKYYVDSKNNYIRKHVSRDIIAYKNMEPCVVKFIPENYDGVVPLDDTDKNTWSITYKDKIYQFDRPIWFNHSHLGNNIPMLILATSVAELW